VSAPVAVIAGAGGAGRATARALAAAGYHVVILDAVDASAQSAAAAVRDAGGSAESAALDLLDLDGVRSLRDSIVGRHGRLDVLVHLVGGWRGTKGLTPDSAANWFALNPPIVGTLATLTSAMGADIAASEAGRVVMVSSTARPSAGNIAYVSAKAAAEAWVLGVADAFTDTGAAAVIVAVRALLTDEMLAKDPGKDVTGFTHVDDLASRITAVCTGPAVNGQRIDLTVQAG
jgi:NAD(P)-dependent dehydrogenase (short-subunit alcohol dehydrogenase family)